MDDLENLQRILSWWTDEAAANKGNLTSETLADLAANAPPEMKDFYDRAKKSHLAQTSPPAQSIQILDIRPAPPGTVSDVLRPASLNYEQVVHAFNATQAWLPTLADAADPAAAVADALLSLPKSGPSLNSVNDVVGALAAVTGWVVRDILHKPVIADWIDAGAAVVTVGASWAAGDFASLTRAGITGAAAVLDIWVQKARRNSSASTLALDALSPADYPNWGAVVAANVNSIAGIIVSSADLLGKAGELTETDQALPTTALPRPPAPSQPPVPRHHDPSPAFPA